MKAPFIWDEYSDQPYPIKDRAYKTKMRKKTLLDSFVLLLINIIIFPLSILLMKFFKSNKSDYSDFYALGVDVDKGSIQKELVDELGVNHLLIRMPLWEMHRIDKFVEFSKSFGDDKTILLNILQDREHIEDSSLLKRDIEIIFKKFGSFVYEYQIGNAINRTKWGFFSITEYLNFFEIVFKVKQKSFPNIKLIGSNVIDFEYFNTIHTLFNFKKFFYDGVGTLLYVMLFDKTIGSLILIYPSNTYRRMPCYLNQIGSS